MLPVKAGATRILDFDIECRPLSYWRDDRPTMEITAIAWAWADRPDVIYAWLLRPSLTWEEHQKQKINGLLRFVSAWDKADIVTGHYIRKFDIGQIQAELAEYGLEGLSPKLTSDTKADLISWGDLPKTQKDLAKMFGVRAPKVEMSQHDWRMANRLFGLSKTRERVTGDVKQHMELRYALLKAGVLGEPRFWRP